MEPMTVFFRLSEPSPLFIRREPDSLCHFTSVNAGFSPLHLIRSLQAEEVPRAHADAHVPARRRPGAHRQHAARAQKQQLAPCRSAAVTAAPCATHKLLLVIDGAD